ncbi:hypothetical protein ACXWO5_09890, partial [Streptococcus pyogenes]
MSAPAPMPRVGTTGPCAIKLFAGNSHPELASLVAKRLGKAISCLFSFYGDEDQVANESTISGVEIGKAWVTKYSNEETSVT